MPSPARSVASSMTPNFVVLLCTRLRAACRFERTAPHLLELNGELGAAKALVAGRQGRLQRIGAIPVAVGVAIAHSRNPGAPSIV
jgi:hypothetical protein